MLTHHRLPVSLSLISTDLPLWSVVETAATLYQKDQERFHLLLTEPGIYERDVLDPLPTSQGTDPAPSPILRPTSPSPRLLWLEISPYRVIMTMQGNSKLSYRHFWESGVYGLSRYWLQDNALLSNGQMRLRNFTRSLELRGRPLPRSLRVEYELWSAKVQLGSYVLNLEIQS